ncbi:hypothetical protein AB0K51_19880 [Kitasatospora sp. NPDC049285]|uniref:hypothetical protein n=1 Tax=Kitasatospora sp. NPDC049285 TaxID=3157096 RepID=UPI00341A8DA4
MAASFGVRFDELAKIQQQFQTVQQRMSEMTQRTGQIKGVMARAVATDLASGAMGNVLNFAAVATQVFQQVEAINQQVDRLHAAKEQLTKELAEDTQKIATVIKRYQEAEKKVHEGVHKAGGEHKAKPKSPGTGNHPGQGKHTGGGDKKPGGGEHGKTGPTQHGNDPTPTVSHDGKIAKGDVTFGGKGKYGSGEAACREYIGKALDAMGITDPQAREAWTKGMLTIALRESSYNSPKWQVNQGPGDVNVNGPVQADGAPLNCSRGGWQTTPGTFAEHHVKGTSTDIYDPVANAAASMDYIMSRYHVSPDGHDLAAKVQQADPGRKPHWY